MLKRKRNPERGDKLGEHNWIHNDFDKIRVQGNNLLTNVTHHE